VEISNKSREFERGEVRGGGIEKIESIEGRYVQKADTQWVGRV
jgi:hypothetical protein